VIRNVSGKYEKGEKNGFAFSESITEEATTRDFLSYLT
jgi:hypothetical protein